MSNVSNITKWRKCRWKHERSIKWNDTTGNLLNIGENTGNVKYVKMSKTTSTDNIKLYISIMSITHNKPLNMSENMQKERF